MSREPIHRVRIYGFEYSDPSNRSRLNPVCRELIDQLQAELDSTVKFNGVIQDQLFDDSDFIPDSEGELDIDWEISITEVDLFYEFQFIKISSAPLSRSDLEVLKQSLCLTSDKSSLTRHPFKATIDAPKSEKSKEYKAYLVVTITHDDLVANQPQLVTGLVNWFSH